MSIPWLGMNIAFDCFGLVISLIPAISLRGKAPENRANRLFIRYAYCNALFLVADSLLTYVYHATGYGAGGLFLCMLCVLLCFANYVCAYVGMQKRTVRRKYTAIQILCAIGAFFALVLGLRRLYYPPDAPISLWSASYAWPFWLFPVLCLFMIAWIVLTQRAFLDKKAARSLLFCISLLAVGICLQQFIVFFSVVCIASTLCLLAIYVTIQNEQSQRLHQRELDLAQSGMDLMLSQIHPHFLYNTLVAVSQLCDIAPMEASETIAKFSQYLRTNVDSLHQHTPIPFADELSHVNLYLFIEKKRFEERLGVVLDIQTTEFEIPALTLQPIVENAVRHGVTKREAGGTIRIATQDTPQGWRIIVEDNGVGFDPCAPREKTRSHLGIDNVRSRLRSLGGGTLEIQSAPGEGTRAVITIPKGDV